MKRFYKFIAAILLCGMLVCMLFGCDNQNTESNAEVSVNNEVSTGEVSKDTENVSDIHAHKYEGAWKSNETNHWKECECGNIYEAVKHAYGEWMVTKEATCTTSAIIIRTCKDCGYSETDTVATAGHDEVIDKAVAPTCTETGLTEGKHCSICNTILVAQTTIPAKGHTMSGIQCSVCGYFNESEGLEFTKNDDGNSYTVTGIGSCDDADIVIPSVYKGKPVTAIGRRAFEECASLKSITIPKSITTIGEGAFWICKSLTSITVSEDNSVYHSSGNCLIKTASKTLIAGCATSVIPGDGSVTKIGQSAFTSCTSLKEITIPKSIKSIGDYAFIGCTSLTSITIPNSVTSIGESAFYGCTSLSNIIIPSSITHIASYVFANCRSLESITIPNSVTTIGEGAFNSCKNLTNITISNNLTDIEQYAFQDCTSLLNITIPKSVNKMGRCIFQECTSLTSITFEGTKSQWKDISSEQIWGGVPATEVTCCDGKMSLNGDTDPAPPEPQPIRVNGVQINKTTMNLNVGNTQQLTANISPSNADNKNVTWLSSNGSVVQVTSTGMITATGVGTAIITVTTVDGNYTAKCTVTVAEPPVVEPPVVEPPVTVPPVIEPPVTETPAVKPDANVLIISDTQTFSNQTIDTDVYITSTGVVTLNNVTINGNIYCYGQLKCSGCTANNVYAYAYGSIISCGAFDGTHGKVSGKLSCNNLVIQDYALDYAFDKWGKQ